MWFAAGSSIASRIKQYLSDDLSQRSIAGLILLI